MLRMLFEGDDTCWKHIPLYCIKNTGQDTLLLNVNLFLLLYARFYLPTFYKQAICTLHECKDSSSISYPTANEVRKQIILGNENMTCLMEMEFLIQHK